MVVPAHDGERTHAVVELGFLHQPDRGGAQLLARIAEPIAVAVRTASYRDRLQKLLDETRRQAEAIKAQDEELRAANEELEERGEGELVIAALQTLACGVLLRRVAIEGWP